jgi:hypothetical protein
VTNRDVLEKKRMKNSEWSRTAFSVGSENGQIGDGKHGQKKLIRCLANL